MFFEPTVGYLFWRSRRESNPLFRLPTCYRDRVVHQPLCAETVFFADVTGVEPAPNCVTGRHLNRLTSHPYLSKWWDSNPHRTIKFVPDPKSGRLPIAFTPSFAVLTGLEPAPRTVTGWYCNHSTTGPCLRILLLYP